MWLEERYEAHIDEKVRVECVLEVVQATVT
jgi:hypothetical protein